jgi:hypothetical protein
MPNNCTAERLLTFAQAAALPWLPNRRSGKRLSIVTLWRWSKSGSAGVRLRTTYVRSTPATTETWLREFFDAVAQARKGEPVILIARTPSRRQRDHAAAERELDLLGVGTGSAKAPPFAAANTKAI